MFIQVRLTSHDRRGLYELTAQPNTSDLTCGRDGFESCAWYQISPSICLVYYSISEFDFHVTVHREKFLTIKPSRCNNFSNLFLEWNYTCFGQFLCPSSGFFHCTHSSGICHRCLLTAASRTMMELSNSIMVVLVVVSKPVRHIPFLCVQWKTPDYGQRKCPKHVRVSFQNKFEKLVHLVGLL
jgi:hypothetical protein